MNRLTILLSIALIAFPALADKHGGAETAVRNSVKAFNSAYENNNVDDYFKFYDADAMLYWEGARQDLKAYHEEWAALVKAGGAVEKNELSDLQVKVMPGGDVAVASYFTDYRLRLPDGETAEGKYYESDVWQKIDGAWKLVALTFSPLPAAE